MASAFHPFYSTLWNDDKLEGARFEEKAFFGYLFTNERVRPSGIYRVTDAQLAGDTGLPLARVRGYLTDLVGRHLIVRDGVWLFVVAYFKRQPKGPWLLKGVHADLGLCSSVSVLEAFIAKYPAHNQQVLLRLNNLNRNGCPTTQRNAVTTQHNATTPLHTPNAAPPLERGMPQDGFTEFWETWPSARRVGKADALKAWRALVPDLMLRQVILAAVEASKQRPDWQREGGRYIPYPHRWLGKRRWEDAPPAAQATLLTEKTAGNLDAAKNFVDRATKHREAP